MSNFYLCDNCKHDRGGFPKCSQKVDCKADGKTKQRKVVMDDDDRPLYEICESFEDSKEETPAKLCETCAKSIKGDGWSLPPVGCVSLASVLGHSGQTVCPEWESPEFGTVENIIAAMFSFIVDLAWDQGKVVGKDEREFAEWLVEALGEYGIVDPESWTWK